MSGLASAHTLIRASAGTGKTFQLTNRYLGLLATDVEPAEVLATTFTRKAAGEILQRAISRIADAADDDRAATSLADATGCEELNRARARRLLLDLLARLDRLNVMTLDSYFAQVAGRFSLELGLPPGWSICDELADASLRSEAIHDLLAEAPERNVERLLSLMTKGEARRSVSQLILDTVNTLYNVFRETSPDAWRRIPRRRALSNDDLATTIHALAAASLPDDRRWQNARDSDVEKALTADWETFLSKGLAGKVLQGETRYYRREIPPELAAIYEKLIDHARAVELGRLADQTEATATLLAHFDEHYRRLKRVRRQARFEDVTEAVVRGWQRGTSGALSWRFDAEVKHLLLDEFQDTSLLQWLAVRPLAEQIVNRATGSIFCVGDVKQAIYGWRGGVPAIFDTLEAQIPSLRSQPLNRSFRSAPAVIDAVNSIFSPAMHQRHGNLDKLEPTVAQWCRDFPPHTTAKQMLRGHVTLQTAPAAADGESQTEATIRHTATLVAELVSKIGSCTLGVLTRKNATVARMIHELRKLGIDASEEGGNPLTDSAAVGAVLSLIRLADHPGDRAAVFHVAQSPLGPVVGLTDHDANETVREVARGVRRTLIDNGYGPTVALWSAALLESCTARDWERLKQLTQMACDFDATSTLRPTDFVSQVQQTRVARATSTQVRVMTVHQAKGLQFDVVVLPELDEQLTRQTPSFVAGRPSADSPLDCVCLYRNSTIQKLLPKSLQNLFQQHTHDTVLESLSLLYVMVTRPVHALHMVVAPSTEGRNRSLHKTFAGLLRAALVEEDSAAAPPAAILYEHGDPLWFVDSTPPKTISTSDTALESRPEPQVIKLAASRASLRRLTTESPSSMEGGAWRTAADLLQNGGQAGRLRGLLIHAWFELIEWLDASNASTIQDQTLNEAAEQLFIRGEIEGELDSQAAGIERTRAEFRAMCSQTEIVAALRQQAYRDPTAPRIPVDIRSELAASDVRLEVRREVAVAARLDERFFSGRADRLVLVWQGARLLWAEVIDYKSDRVSRDDPTALQAKLEFYRPQIESYCQSVAQMFRLNPRRVTGRLLMVDAGVVLDV